jgi:uncharacterized repeat protein (TIGR01451 family)
MTNIRTNLLRLFAYRLLCLPLQIVTLLLFGVVATSPTLAFASEASQCANTKRDTNPDTCEEWVNGNLNQSKASYFEGESIPYRVVLDPALPGNTYQITLGWDAVESDKNALDYLTSFHYSVTQADPCEGGNLCNLAAPNDTVAIPTDTRMARGRDDLPGTSDDVPQAPGDFVVWGGMIQSVGDYHYPADFDYASSHEITITLRIVATANRVVLAWGGHIASRLDWGKSNGAVNINGSPYHMRATGTEFDNQGQLVSNIAGIQGDLSLASGAVVFPSYLNVTKEADRSTADTFLFRTNGTGDGISNGSFTLTNGQTLPIRIEGNSSAYVEEDLSQLLDLYGNPLWMLDSVVCSDNVTVTRSGDRIDLALGEALQVDCYFKNVFTGLPKLELTKKVVPAAASCETLDFSSTGNETLDIASGDTVRYCYRVHNAGNDIAYDLSLEDDAGTTVLSDDFAVALTGGDLAEHGKNSAVADLGVAGNTYGEATVQIGLPVGGSLTNTATASGLDFFDMPIADDDTATVNVTRAQTCTLAAGVSTTGNCDDASAVANVIESTPLTWCADVCMDAGNSDLNSTTIALASGDTVLEAVAAQALSAGSCHTWTFNETAGSESDARQLTASGVDDFTNPIGCMDNVTANVFDPNIAVRKRVSLDNTCGNGDDTDEATVYYGTRVWYCLSVRNLGDEDLVDVKLVDPLLGLNLAVPDLAAGSAGWESPAYSYGSVSGDIHNTATASARGKLTRHSVSHDDSADVHMTYADIRVEKTGTARLNAKENETAVSYTVTVTNIGNVTAKGVVLTDTLPALIDYVADTAGCDYDATGHTLTCGLGDIKPGALNAVVIGVTAQLAQPVPIFGIFENLACAEVTGALTPDINMDNNCDTQATRIVPGATRTIGFWQNHPDFLAQCLAVEDNTVTLDRAADGNCGSGTSIQVHGIDLGYVKIASEMCDNELDATVSSALTGNGNGRTKSLVVPEASADEDSDIETALEAALGALKASPAHWTDGAKRSDLDQARTTAGRQVLAAICNVTLLDALHPDFLDDYLDVLQGADIEAILRLGAYADTYNNSGDDEPIGDPGSADPDANSDDYTDPTD